MKSRLFLLSFSAATLLLAGTASDEPDAIVENYRVATETQARLTRGATMNMEIEAALPKLKKAGKLSALRRITSLGRITYEALKFEGDGTVKNQVIARYLSAEAEAQTSDRPGALAVTPENYKFSYKGKSTLNGREVHVFQVTPKKKLAGLFKGEVRIDAATYLRVQESGYLVKNPSIFLKRVEFVRTYEIRNGVSVPKQVQSVVETRLAGKAELTVDYSNYSTPAVAELSGWDDLQ